MQDKSTRYLSELIASAGQIIQIEAGLFKASADAAADVDWIPFTGEPEPELELYSMPHLTIAIESLIAVRDTLNNSPTIVGPIPDAIASPVKHQYRILSDAEKAAMARVKDAGRDLIAMLHEIGGTAPDCDRMGSRDLALAQTHIEDAIMRAVRHITA